MFHNESLNQLFFNEIPILCPTVQAETGGQMVKMEAKHETNAIFAFTTLAKQKI